MTLEGEGPSPEDTPAPPARTRWSEDTADDEPGLMPPYVRGGRTSAAGQSERELAPEPEIPAVEDGREAGDGDAGDFPFDAFDIERGGEDAWAEAGSGVEDTPDTAAAEGAFGTPLAEGPPAPWSSDELAGRLERLADALRRDGRAGVERELGSGDRLTSLIAGVLAGYLARLDD
ncbi:MAG TPA: hypothetical protein VMM83_01440 [Longimicrobiales bacterium]|nr:hypothetical protein [Longimicrobiales bacterium]